MIAEIAAMFRQAPVIAITDSWFSNNGLYAPLRKKLGQRFHMVSRLGSNNNLFEMLDPCAKRGRGRPRKYGTKLGDDSSQALAYQPLASEYKVTLYGRPRRVLAYERIAMLKTLKTAVKVVWVYRKTQWVALFSTDLTLTAQEIIEYYGARWKIEAASKELKRDIGNAGTQTRHPNAVANHLHFCMMATSLTWIYASRLEKTPSVGMQLTAAVILPSPMFEG